MSTTPNEPRRLEMVEVSPGFVASVLFGRCDPASLIPVVSKRSGPSLSEPYPRPFFPLRVSELQRFPDVLGACVAMGHPEVYTMAATLKPRSAKQEPIWRGRGVSFRFGNDDLYEIAAIALDLDVGRTVQESALPGATLSAAEAIEKVDNLVLQSVLPTPTLLAQSGRGLYLIYVLDSPLRWSPDAGRARLETARALRNRVSDLAADVSFAHAPAHLFKAPRVADIGATFYFVHRGSAEPRKWLHDELRRAVGLPPATNIRLPQRVRSKRASHNRPWTATAAPLIQRRRELQLLARHRGKAIVGVRHALLLFYATTERFILLQEFMKQGRTRAAIDAAALLRTLSFNQSLPAPQNEADIRAMFRTHPVKPQQNDTIAEQLHVTEAEVSTLALKSLLPPAMRRRILAEKRARREKQEQQRQYAVHLLKQGRPVAEIGAETGLSRASIYRLRKRLQNSDGRSLNNNV